MQSGLSVGLMLLAKKLAHNGLENWFFLKVFISLFA